MSDDFPPEGKPLRRGWTTGACATAASTAALSALLGDGFPDPVTITLPGGQRPAFALARERLADGEAEAAIIKDAGDDPDITHGALVWSRVQRGAPGSGVTFSAGEGVGTVTKPGLPLPVGEPAINPVPRAMMRQAVEELGARHGIAPDFHLTIGVENGRALAEKTWNPRLGIVGGLSILGTTGIVVPYSCAAWIHSIHRGIDVARALGLAHVVGSTGDASERAAMARLALPLEAYLDMGDFVGGLLKYLRAHPVPRLTLAGGFGKFCKLADGAMDLHSARSQVDVQILANLLKKHGATSYIIDAVCAAQSAHQALLAAGEYGPLLCQLVAEEARQVAQKVLGDAARVDILVVDRLGTIIGESG